MRLEVHARSRRQHGEDARRGRLHRRLSLFVGMGRPPIEVAKRVACRRSRPRDRGLEIQARKVALGCLKPSKRPRPDILHRSARIVCTARRKVGIGRVKIGNLVRIHSSKIRSVLRLDPRGRRFIRSIEIKCPKPVGSPTRPAPWPEPVFPGFPIDRPPFFKWKREPPPAYRPPASPNSPTRGGGPLRGIPGRTVSPDERPLWVGSGHAQPTKSDSHQAVMGEAAWRDDALAIVDHHQPLDVLPPRTAG